MARCVAPVGRARMWFLGEGDGVLRCAAGRRWSAVRPLDIATYDGGRNARW
jgi:hypothetical protein